MRNDGTMTTMNLPEESDDEMTPDAYCFGRFRNIHRLYRGTLDTLKRR